MLSVIFELRIDWYTNKSQTNSTVNEMKYSGIPISKPAGQYQQPSGTVFCYKMFFSIGLQPSGTVPMIMLS